MIVVGIDDGDRDAGVRREITSFGATECGIDHEVVTVELDPHRRDVGAAVGVEARHVREDLFADEFASGGCECVGHVNPVVEVRRER